ncbi:hypothetical protein [Asticcacaulis sp. YBE204]|uniref:hypothetical protein n=1 Tax=Asticcacaulis sp. YBE204 TaxID=1282363 RepID=UPI0003C3AD85|nr:hypothetical protein [Asticcacaulis sp. YBE204]ESQ79425.1 hypothetical protein AEYBE204_10485 [Asticcacaulis sp. YBE204]
MARHVLKKRLVFIFIRIMSQPKQAFSIAARTDSVHQPQQTAGSLVKAAYQGVMQKGGQSDMGVIQIDSIGLKTEKDRLHKDFGIINMRHF